MKRAVKLLKDFLLYVPLTLLVGPLTRAFLFLAYFNKLLLWIFRNKKLFAYSDYWSPVRDYEKRYNLYGYVNDHHAKQADELLYLEFGVAAGTSFNWWMAHNSNPSSRFFGFDTFEGLPEKWGAFYDKGDMKFSMPPINDERGQFIKGLFQDTLTGFIRDNDQLLRHAGRRVIMLDADLYSATIFTLSQLYPYLRAGDIIMFDEFNVPMHEFKAYLEFTGNFYVNLKPVAAVNNFYQVAFEVRSQG